MKAYSSQKETHFLKKHRTWVRVYSIRSTIKELNRLWISTIKKRLSMPKALCHRKKSCSKSVKSEYLRSLMIKSSLSKNLPLNFQAFTKTSNSTHLQSWNNSSKRTFQSQNRGEKWSSFSLKLLRTQSQTGCSQQMSLKELKKLKRLARLKKLKVCRSIMKSKS